MMLERNLHCLLQGSSRVMEDFWGLPNALLLATSNTTTTIES
jgi:hypothetical protein